MAIEISIELLAIGIPILFALLFWFLLFLIKQWKIWRYKPENDKGKQAEDRRIGEGVTDIQRTQFPKRRSVFQTPITSRTIGDKNSTSKSSRINGSSSNPFRRR